MVFVSFGEAFEAHTLFECERYDEHRERAHRFEVVGADDPSDLAAEMRRGAKGGSGNGAPVDDADGEDQTALDDPNAAAAVVRSNGEQRFQKFMQLLRNGFTYEPSLFQVEFLVKVAQCLARMVVGPRDWPYVGPRLAQRYNWDLGRMSLMLLAKAPRRFGKTVALSIAGTCPRARAQPAPWQRFCTPPPPRARRPFCLLAGPPAPLPPPSTGCLGGAG